MSMVAGEYLCIDDNFQLPKYIRDSDGTPLFTAMTTVMNEYNEVCARYWKPDQSYKTVMGALGLVAKRYDKEGVKGIADGLCGNQSRDVIDNTRFRVPGPRAVAPHDPVLCRLMCACEATLPQLLLSSSASSQLLSGYTLPNVLSSGVLTVTATTAMASETSAELVASNGSAASETKATSSPHGKGPIGPENETAKGSSETSPPPSHTGCGASLETSADEAPPALAERSQAACEYPFVLLTQMKDQMSGCQNLREASPLLSASSHMEVARQLGDLVGRLHLAGRAAAALLDPAGLRPGSRANAAAALLDPAGLRPGSHANAEWTRPGSQAGSIHASGPRGHAPQPLENGGKKWVPPPASPPHRGHAPWPLETGDEKRTLYTPPHLHIIFFKTLYTPPHLHITLFNVKLLGARRPFHMFAAC
eukprot:gene5298-18542_t